MTDKMNFLYFVKICKEADVDIGSIGFESEGFKGQVKATLRLKGTYIEVAQKLEQLVKALQPFIEDEFCGKWLHFNGSMDLHNFTGILDVEVGFRGMNINFESFEEGKQEEQPDSKHDCRVVRCMLYCYRALSPAQKKLVNNHVADCPDCQKWSEKQNLGETTAK